MGTLLDQIQLTQQTKENIKSAIREKDIEVLDTDKFSEYPDKIRAIGNDDEWKPNPDWYDIDKILEDDTEDYVAKMICLLRDEEDITTINRLSADKIKTSDGVEYDKSSNSYQHTWNKEFDKSCDDGYNTRYVIWYYSTQNINAYNSTVPQNSTIYAIMKNFDITTNFNTLSAVYKLECIKFINTVFRNNFLFFNSNYNLVKIEGLVTKTNNLQGSGTGTFQSDWNLKELDLTADYNVEYRLRNTFSGCYNLKIYDLEDFNIDISKAITLWSFLPTQTKKIKRFSLKNINISSNNNWIYSLNGLHSLEDIEIVDEIKVSGININQCYSLTHSTLIKILNALYDYSEQEDVYQITLGGFNLNKLSDEEKAIATEKGWTLS